MRKPWLITLGLLAAAVLAAYAYNFGPASGWQPSTHTEDWARFGEYIGGIFGFLAFIGVLGTIQMQRRQLEWQQAHTTLDELLYEARHLASAIELVLGGPIEKVAITAQQLSAQGKPSTVFGVLEMVDLRSSAETERGTAAAPLVEAKSAYRKSLVGSTGALSEKLDLLAAVLSEFVSRGGDSIFLLFYRDRFRMTVRRLVGLEVAVSTADWWLLSTEESESRRWRF